MPQSLIKIQDIKPCELFSVYVTNGIIHEPVFWSKFNFSRAVGRTINCELAQHLQNKDNVSIRETEVLYYLALVNKGHPWRGSVQTNGCFDFKKDYLSYPLFSCIDKIKLLQHDGLWLPHDTICYPK